MCGRYLIRHPREEMQRSFAYSSSEIRLPPRYNIAPTTEVPIVCQRENGGRELALVRWGLIPSWAGPDAKIPLMINARCETVASKPAFRSAFKKRRCIFLASGYYEWQKLPGGKKQPFLIERADSSPLAFAGLWEFWKGDDGREITSAAIVTTAAVADLATIHDRMPVFLPESAWERWLAPEPLPETDAAAIFGAGLTTPMHSVPIRQLVNSIRNDGEELLKPAEPEGDLFGAT